MPESDRTDVIDPPDLLELLFELTVLLSDHMEIDLRRRGLTRARARVIWCLHHHGSTTHGALAEALDVTPRNVTGLVDALEEDGFVFRRPHPTDRRASLVALTDFGRHTALGMHEDELRLAVQLMGHLSPEQASQFAGSVTDIVGRLREAVSAS